MTPTPADPNTDCPAAIRDVTTGLLAPQQPEIDAGLYPEDVMRAYGQAGAFAAHCQPGASLMPTIRAMADAGQVCGNTAFVMWCQSALGWYLSQSGKPELAELLEDIASGRQLGGTGLSNPVKALYGIEKNRLRATRVEGGWQVRGVLPWVSNIHETSWLAVIMEVPGPTPHQVMAVIRGGDDGVKIVHNEQFIALEGSRTSAVQLRDAFIPDAHVLADPVAPFLGKIRAGFILLQMGMAIGALRGAIAQMRLVDGSLGHVNRYLEDGPEALTPALEDLIARTEVLAATPLDPSPDYFRKVLQLRLDGSELTLRAAQAAMLHWGARGYIKGSAVERALREAYFVAVVTPATKQLRLMLADPDLAGVAA